MALGQVRQPAVGAGVGSDQLELVTGDAATVEVLERVGESGERVEVLGEDGAPVEGASQ